MALRPYYYFETSKNLFISLYLQFRLFANALAEVNENERYRYKE